MTKERPILFSTPMVRALLNGTKTQTRRVMKPQPPDDCGGIEVGPYHPTITRRGADEPGPEVFGAYSLDGSWGVKCPHGQLGSHLWVRETWLASSAHDSLAPRDIPQGDAIEYGADSKRVLAGKLRPSMFMPRWASRINLEITDIQVERLQDISEADAMAEGIRLHPDHHHRPRESSYGPVATYKDLWENINDPGSWDLNPLVWAISFKVINP